MNQSIIIINKKFKHFYINFNMSSIYSTEPPTSGKVILVTNFGNIDIELWTKEAPRACRNFIQLCLEGYYNNCVFFRIIKGFLCV